MLCDDADAEAWAWAQWLPHAQPAGRVPAMIGNTDDSRRERLREAAVTLDLRMRVAGQRGAEAPGDLVIVVDGARDLRMLPGMVPILEHGTAHGIHVDRARHRAGATARRGEERRRHRRRRRRARSLRDRHGVLPDRARRRRLTRAPAEQVARSLCSIRHVSGVGDDAMLPTSVRMVDLLKIDLDDPAPLVKRWQTQPRNTFVVVGANADGEFALDISRDGPHALVAGTTGFGQVRVPAGARREPRAWRTAPTR